MDISKIDMKKVTPMMKQYIETKNMYSDCILFFRLGDFYEMFFEDAILASNELEIALTRKACGLEEKAPMCGVPHHSAESYISRLVEKGYKVAIGEQVEDPKEVKGIVKREVVRVVTPGTLLDESFLDNKSNNYLLSVTDHELKSAIAFIDISTGELKATLVDSSKVLDELMRINPSEILVEKGDMYNLIKKNPNFSSTLIDIVEDADEKYSPSQVKRIMKEYFNQEQIKNARGENTELVFKAISMCLDYVSQTQKQAAGNINDFKLYSSDDFMILDGFTRVNLELTQTIRGGDKKGSLLHVLDKTSTAMGGRLLKKYIEEPLVSEEKINKRLNLIDELVDDFSLKLDVVDILKRIYDIERICAKIAYDKVNPKEIVSLKESIRYLKPLKSIICESETHALAELVCEMDDLEDIFTRIDTILSDEAGISSKDGNIVNDGVNERLDELRNIYNNGASIIKDIELREREKLQAKTLKIGYNKVFGYYLDISRAQLATIDLPEEYIRKQTLSNSERFITPELKEIEDKIINAEGDIKEIEYNIFRELRDFIYANISRIQSSADILARLDVACSMSTIALENNYTRPEVRKDIKFVIKDGRHPVIESITGMENFVPNDTEFDDDTSMINIITGPNMSGKSTYMRQTAIIALMAHIGSYVPASKAEIPLLDRIFTRVGASDDLAHGQSTFMVEMSEVSHIMSNATENSLIILDEIGRGTSTYDGMSLAWSIVEYIHNNIRAKTLFATHYHELTDLENEYEDVCNYSVSVREDGDDIVFLRKIVKQAADRSYGIYVAKLARVPDEIIDRANDILLELEKNHEANANALIASVGDRKSPVSESGNEEDDGADSLEENKETDDIICEDEESIGEDLSKTRENYIQEEKEKPAEKDKNKKENRKEEKPEDKKEDKEDKKEESKQLSFELFKTEDDIKREKVLERLEGIDIMSLTPMDAMNILYELKKGLQ